MAVGKKGRDVNTEVADSDRATAVAHTELGPRSNFGQGTIRWPLIQVMFMLCGVEAILAEVAGSETE